MHPIIPSALQSEEHGQQRQQRWRTHGGVRVGRILRILDTLGGRRRRRPRREQPARAVAVRCAAARGGGGTEAASRGGGGGVAGRLGFVSIRPLLDLPSVHRLRSLWLRDAISMGEEAATQLVLRCPSLTSVGLPGCAGLTDTACMQLCALPSLTELSLARNPQLSARALLAIASVASSHLLTLDYSHSVRADEANPTSLPSRPPSSPPKPPHPSSPPFVGASEAFPGALSLTKLERARVCRAPPDSSRTARARSPRRDLAARGRPPRDPARGGAPCRQSPLRSARCRPPRRRLRRPPPRPLPRSPRPLRPRGLRSPAPSRHRRRWRRRTRRPTWRATGSSRGWT